MCRARHKWQDGLMMDDICRRVHLVANRKLTRVSAGRPAFFEERDDDVHAEEGQKAREVREPDAVSELWRNGRRAEGGSKRRQRTRQAVGLVEGDVLELPWEQLEWSLEDGITPLAHGDLEHEAAVYERLRPI
ncbi:hypothetical protein BHE90_016710 [Fusarium euwallaceae]|uniref:Uncharacterized protein n=2 Tax=Fusarium solani species complex TaxID=232080 RepID=A0A430KZM5_9HYPO|nr:hypothetical protein CDV31_016839 [Fusarium ambrosium]RTE68910.1 hypothetical protein BHE90_016710 [Fusarium euwallaceae]